MVKNESSYINSLGKALQEKMFFVDKVELFKYDLIVDFGGATGELLNEVYLTRQAHSASLLVYDINDHFLAEGKRKYPNINFTSDFDFVKNQVQRSSRTLAIFSTVLHEVDASSFQDCALWLMTNAHTIVIRDMHAPLHSESLSGRVRRHALKQVAPWQARLFESRWGKIKDTTSFYRFLLMNEFVNNYENEVEEDYFSTPWMEIKEHMSLNGYDCKHDRVYVLPYRKNQVKYRFNYVMTDITHREMIFMKSQKREKIN